MARPTPKPEAPNPAGRAKRVAAIVALSAAAVGVIAVASKRPAEGSFVGVYTIERYTQNTNGCDAEGPAVAKAPACVYLREESWGKDPYLVGGAVGRLEQCQDGLAGKTGFSHDLALVFAHDVRTATPSGQMSQSALPEDGVCRARAEQLSLRRLDGDRVRMEIRTTRVAYPGQSVRDCSTGDTLREATGKACGELTVIEARRR